ncbi:MAG: cache domain-containing protein [Desulfotignum sp.]|nr:cache domain-containing protein [Desulfobacteraceae bacterium]
MNLLHLFTNLPIRYKILCIFSFTFFVIMGLSSLTIYSIVRQNVEKNIENELDNATSAMVNTVKTAASVSIKNYLRATAEKNLDIVRHLYRLEANGELTRAQAKKQAADMMLAQKIGTNGYICILDGTGRVVKHPKKLLEGLDISDHEFVQEMVLKKKGYIEYDWQNPDDETPRPKALYLAYFGPWDWMITVSSYRKEFFELMDINDFTKSILGQRFGKTGYASVMNTKGQIIIHPELTGINVLSSSKYKDTFFMEMLEKKNGKLTHSWSSSNTLSRKKLVYFNHLPEYNWIVASSIYIDEFFSPLETIKNFILIVGLVSFVIFIPITFFVSATITDPLRKLMDRLNEDIMDGFSNRMVTTHSLDEVGQISFYYNSFMEKLEAYSLNLKAQIAERKLAQEALQESEERYRSVMEAAPDPIIVYDMDGCVTYLNPAFTRVFGYSPAESLGRKMDHFVPEEHWKETMEGIHTILAGKVLPRTETIRKARDGRLIEVTLRGSVYRDKHGNPLGTVITHRDVSRVKQLEKAIMETGEKERQKIGNDLHDDLCPHLIGVEGLSKVLKTKVKKTSPEAVHLAENITELIQQAIQKTRLLARGLCPVYFKHGLLSSLQELAANTRMVHRVNCSLLFHEKILAGSDMVNINLYHITQEAVQNAIRHGNADRILIEMKYEKTLFLLSITDNGTGIVPSEEARGMGMRIMNYRAKLMGASLDIDSGPTGTCVTLKLPVSALHPPGGVHPLPLTGHASMR